MTSVESVKIQEGYKQTEVGVIPEDWGISTVNNVSLAPMQNGLFYEPQRKGKGVPLINVGDMYASAPIDVSSLDLFDATHSEIKVFKVQKGDLFFTRSSIVPSGIAYCNTFKEENTVAVFDSHLIRVRPDPKVMDADFLYLNCIANHARKFLISSAKTATMTTIDQGAIKKCPVLVPPLKEQTAIANALSDVDNLIASLETLIAKKNAIKTASMQQLLTGKKRLPAFVKESAKQGEKQSSELENTSEAAQAAQTKQASTLNIDLYKESDEGFDSKSNQQSEVSNANNKQTVPRPGYKQTELGEIPEDWDIRTIASLCTIMTGSTPATNNPAYYGEEFMFASPADLKGQKYVSNKKVIS
jgi:restriction endonuclease S subunit